MVANALASVAARLWNKKEKMADPSALTLLPTIRYGPAAWICQDAPENQRILHR